MRIALLEDDRDTANIMTVWIESDGHHVARFESGGALTKALQRETYDLLILDWLLPDINGDEVLRWVREHVGWQMPVIFITQKDSQEDIVAGLNLGADDYMTKPVDAAELLARISAVARRYRQHPESEASLECAPFRFDLSGHTVMRDTQPLALTQKEYELALFLFRNIGRLLSRAHILESVWGRSADVTTRTVDIHVSRLRKKMGLSEESGWRLSAVYYHGYRLESVAGADVSLAHEQER